MFDYNEGFDIKDVASYSFKGQLSQRSDDMLRGLAEEPEIGVNPELSRDMLIDEIAKKLATPEILRIHLSEYMRHELDFFRDAVKQREVRGDSITPGNYGIANANGLLALYNDSEGYFCVMPDEIRAAFLELEQTNFLADWERLDLLRTYGRAAVELYGAVRAADVVEIFNGQNNEQTDEQEFTKAVSESCHEYSGLVVEEDYLFNDMEFDEWEDIEDVIYEADRRSRYVPSKDEVLVMGAVGYWPDTPQSKAVEDFLDENLKDKFKPRDIEEIVLDLQFLFQRKKWRLNDLSPIINKVTGYMTKSLAQSFLNLVMDMANNTRSWLNNGHTPNELFEKYERPALTPLPTKPFDSSLFQSVAVPKVGRNEPCPCGSGQKYKRCCGK